MSLCSLRNSSTQDWVFFGQPIEDSDPEGLANGNT